MTGADWLGLCQSARDDVVGVLAELPGRAEREPVVGDGEGGDETTAIDAAAEAAFLVRAPTVAQVAAFAARGETMPQKSTFFYPKLTSGLLFHPVPSPHGDP